MPRLLVLPIALLLSLAALACGQGEDRYIYGGGGDGGGGGSGPVSTCDQAHCTVDVTAFSCTQYGDRSDVNRYREACERFGTGTWAEGPCESHGVGGCRRYDGTGCKLTWYDEPFTAETAREACEEAGFTFVEP